jgi:hypothetical protein
MIKYILKRLIVIIPLLLAMSLFAFIFMQKTTGSFYDSLRMNPLISQETIERYVRLYQLQTGIRLFISLQHPCRSYHQRKAVQYLYFILGQPALDMERGYPLRHLGGLAPESPGGPLYSDGLVYGLINTEFSFGDSSFVLGEPDRLASLRRDAQCPL